ncbi:Flp pilus assembly complex ATPase component TadA [Patescibacteria group bacterium]|nr:Flp pilus assembly complex ATPase component TadA [Patescibacteria group bacterium]
MTQGDSKVLKFLVKSGSLSQEHYDQLLAEAREVSLSPDALLDANKLIPEEEISQAKSSVYDLPGAELYGLSVDRKILQIIPRETAENYQVVSFAKEGKVLKTAILNPGDFKAREAVNFIARQNNLKVEFYTAPASALKNILAQYTGLAIEVEEAVGAAEKRFAPTGKKIELGLEEMSQAAPIAKLVASILKYAVDNQASDVHIEPFNDKSRVRYRIDGILRETAMLPGHLHSAIISRIKVMSNLKLDETRIPQDGRIRVMVSKRNVDMRVSIFPLLGNEKAVMRILDPARRIFDLKDLGFWGIGIKAIQKNLARPHGMVLITGPTGCGKSTTLYAAMKRLNQSSVNIMTLEDPIEYFLPGINQSQVQPDIGYSFASGIRSVIRQDPDIIMVGEIRDSETASLATHAALTGHIVLSTLHTNDALGAVPRLIDMDIEPFLIASSLNLVVAQRLVRKICSHCKQVIELPAETEKSITEALKDIKEINLDTFKSKKTGRLEFYRGAGCPRCNNEGYRGRIAIFEVLEVTEEMKELIVRQAGIKEIKQEFERQKMIEMIKEGYIKALQGITTLEEVLRAARE